MTFLLTYLTGMLDEFFEDRYAPIIETNRSCPYRCTFCAWGIGTQKLQQFREQRVLDEIEYIAKRCKKNTTVFIADANFGILERDAIFAKKRFTRFIKNMGGRKTFLFNGIKLGQIELRKSSKRI